MPYNAQVKVLCDEGKFQEAINLARTDFSNNRHDKWCIINLGLSYYKIIKNKIDIKDFKTAKHYLSEFDLFNIIDDNIERVRSSVDPEKSIILEAKSASKSGNHREALKLFRDAYKKFPDDNGVNEGLGWEIKKEIDILTKEPKQTDLKSMRLLLKEFLDLKVKKPSKLYSLILFQVDRVSDFYDKYPYFVREWGLENLNTEQSTGNWD